MPRNKEVRSKPRSADLPREPERVSRAATIPAVPATMPGSKVVLTVILLILALTAGAMLSFHLIYEPDLGWHLAQGREVAAGHLVRTNLFSFTNPNYPQPFQSWLFELGAYGLWQTGGAVAIQSAQTLLIALTLAMVYMASRTRVPIATALAVAALGVFLIEPRAVPRPHVASFALGAVCAYVVEKARQTRSPFPLLWAIPLIALWSNIHAESFFGAALVGMFAFGEFVRPQALTRHQAWIALGIAAACTLANAVNPFGIGLFQYIWEGSQAPEFVRIAELRPAYLPTYAPFFAYLALGAGLLLWKRRTVAVWEVLVFLAFAVLALRHVRFVSLFLCVTAPMVAARLADLLGKYATRIVIPAVALVAGFLLSPIPLDMRFKQLGVGAEYLETPDMFSTGAISFIRSAGLKGPVFNSNNLGGYLIWNCYPDVRVFQDGRFQSYPPQHFQSIIAAYQSQSEWDKLVAGVDWAVLTMQRNSPLTGAGRFPAEQWAPVYRDNAVAVVVRRSGKYGALAARP